MESLFAVAGGLPVRPRINPDLNRVMDEMENRGTALLGLLGIKYAFEATFYAFTPEPHGPSIHTPGIAPDIRIVDPRYMDQTLELFSGKSNRVLARKKRKAKLALQWHHLRVLPVNEALMEQYERNPQLLLDDLLPVASDLACPVPAGHYKGHAAVS